LRYFNGFSLRGEEALFGDFLVRSDLCVAGFSYGAQQALEYVYHTKERVDRLILLSPAFFQTKPPAFIRTQLRYFKADKEADKEAYISQFLANVAFPSQEDLSSHLHAGSDEDLEALLRYRWEEEKLREITARGTVIEVFLGGQDKIIDAEAALAFFEPLAVNYYIKEAGHLLHP